jgi:hypothetical protein
MISLRQRLQEIVAACALSCALLAPAHAVPVTHAGHLGGSSSVIGSAGPGSGPYDAADSWQFWTFDAIVNVDVTIMVERLAAGIDPVFGVWFGQEADTASYFDMFSSSLHTAWMGAGDDELGSNPLGGPGGDALLTFTPPGTGRVVIAVGNYADAAGPLGYRLTVNAVPEPGSYAMLGAGLLALLVAARRRNSAPRPTA